MITKAQAQRLRKLIQEYADAQELDSWAGGSDPEEIEPKREYYLQVKKALAKYIRSLTKKK